MERTKWVGKWLLTWIVYVLVFSVIGMLFPVSPEIMAKISSVDAKYTPLAIIVVTLCESFLLNYIVANTRITGFRLFGALFALAWGTQTFMTQIETIIFIKAFPDLNVVGVLTLMAGSFLVYLCVIPFVMLVRGKWKKANETGGSVTVSEAILKNRWYVWLPAISVLYVVLYFSFGFFPISFPETKEYYRAWTESLGASDGLRLIGMQLIRGILWCFSLLPLFFILRGSKEKKMALAAVFFGVFTAFQLMYPNGLMPPMVRFGHFAELFSSMFIFGALVSWMIVRESDRV